MLLTFGDASHQQVKEPLVNTDRMVEQNETNFNFAFALIAIEDFVPEAIDPSGYLEIGLETDVWFPEFLEDGSLFFNWTQKEIKTQKCTLDDIATGFYKPSENNKDFTDKILPQMMCAEDPSDLRI